MISLIETIRENNETVYVRAIIEDMIEMYPQTLYEPAEYGPALCETSFQLEDGKVLPVNEEELIDYLEKLDLDWDIVDTSDYDFNISNEEI